MIVFGISLSYNSSACVVDSKRGIMHAISEERFTNEKNSRDFPINALRSCVDFILESDLYRDEIVKFNVAITSYETLNSRDLKYFPDLKDSERSKDFYSTVTRYIKNRINDLRSSKFHYFRADHHLSHRLPAVALSGFVGNFRNKARTIAITYDGFGDGQCATIYDTKTQAVLDSVPMYNSLALVYQFVTGALGFTEHKHEGKITGLSGFGSPIYVNEFEKIIKFDPEIKDFDSVYLDTICNLKALAYNKSPFNTNIKYFSNFLLLRQTVYEMVENLKRHDASREDIAASLQKYVEMQITDWIDSTLYKNEIGDEHLNFVLSGGLFANVKLNFELKRNFGLKNIFVYPAMGDEGTCVGAALAFLQTKMNNNFMSELCFSRDILYNGLTLEEQLEAVELNHIFIEECIDLDIDFDNYDLIADPTENQKISVFANNLALNKIVCTSIGDSEFGPRALGNHSIFFDATKEETNTELNKKLNRTEFMPFAPIVLDIFADDLFEQYEGAEKTCKYMTIALPCKKDFRETYLAAVHVDGTARPQVIGYNDNETIYKAIHAYFRITGNKALVNTSFNLHNFPIIRDPQIAISSFLKADLDVLILDNLIIIKRG